MSLGQNIKRLRWEAGLRTQRALAELLGIPPMRVSDFENDLYDVRTSTLIKLAKGLCCSLDELVAGVDPDYDRLREEGGVTGFKPAAHDDSSIETRADIPVVGEGCACPLGITSDDRGREPEVVLRWLSRPGDLRDPNAYGVRIRGNSMLPAHPPNTIAIVSPGRRVRERDEVYVQLASGECLVRLVHTVWNGFVLQSYNPAFAPRLVKAKAIRAMHVIVYSRRQDC